MREVSTGSSRRVAERITPVRPRPPVVASKSGVPGRTVRIPPSAVRSSSAVTCRPKEPEPWWFLPWMSAAIAPPTVTYRVPGVTGTNQPSGSSASISRCRLTPASQTTSPAVVSRARIRSRPVMSRTVPPAFCAASPYARPRPRATAPRGPQPRTASTASTCPRGRRTRARVGAVRPQPLSASQSSSRTWVSTAMKVTV
ncbi:hypothetical protein STANM309S_05646 [Streptomyces tanashiensis]